jgi:hypothetical protein
MDREDSYRKRWMAQELQTQPASPVAENAGSNYPSQYESPAVKKQLFSDPGAAAKRRNVDSDTSLAFLSSSHRIFLADRYARKEYSWKLQVEVVDGSKELILRWREVNDNSAVGQVNLSDIKGIFSPRPSGGAGAGNGNPGPSPPAVELGISVDSSPRALLGSGGRAVLSLVFHSEQNCKQFGDALKNVIESHK